MQVLMIITSSLLLAHSALSTPYQYVRPCKSYTEPCISLGCGTVESGGIFPHSTTYSCCAGKIFDGKNHVCATIGGVTLLLNCNPCTQFRCGDAQCTLAAWKCDGIKNCQDGSDEMGCGCGKDNFRCANGRCVGKHHVCDKVNNCGDGTDETHCLRPSGTACSPNSYRCANNKCINKQLVCDHFGLNNCGDLSDQRGCLSLGKKRNTIREHNDEEDSKAKEKNNPKDAETRAMVKA